MIKAHEEDFWRRAVERWKRNAHIRMLGNLEADRLSIVSFVVRAPAGRYLHHNYVVALLNDLFGIQARGGCSCAGPYGHRLLGIGLERSQEYKQVDEPWAARGSSPAGRESRSTTSSPRPSSSTSSRRSISSQRTGWRLLPAYRFDPLSGLWRHRDGAVEPPFRLDALTYDELSGELVVPDLPHEQAPESALAGYLEEARRILESASEPARREPAPGSATTSSSCAGSSCPSAAWPDGCARRRSGRVV